MPNKAQLSILRKGVNNWNNWRKTHPNLEPDLSGADLRGPRREFEAIIEDEGSVAKILRDEFIEGIDLRHADLSSANLEETNIARSDLSETNLRVTKLQRANLEYSDFTNADLSGADLTEANLNNAKLHKVNLTNADLTKAHLNYADLTEANLCGASLASTSLSGANLSGAAVNESTTYHNLKECIVGVNGIWNKTTDSAALMKLIPPGNSMQGPNPNAVIESLKRARRLHGYSMSLVGIILLIEILKLPKIPLPYTEGVEVTPDRFGLLAMPMGVALLSLVNTFMADALKGARYLQDRQSAMTVGNFPWVLSKYAGGKQSFIYKIQPLFIRLIMSFHPVIYIYYLGEWEWNVFPRPAFYILSALLFIFSGWTFYLSHCFQRPILFDRKTEEERRDNLTKLTEAVQAQTKVVTELVDILKPKQVDNFSNTNGRNNNH